MKKLTTYILLTFFCSTINAQEVTYINIKNGKEFHFSRQKDEVVIHLRTDSLSNLFIKTLENYGQVEENPGLNINTIHVKCYSGLYNDLLSLCRDSANRVMSFCPVLSETSSSIEVSCTGEIIAMLKDNADVEQLKKTLQQLGYSTAIRKTLIKGRYIIPSNTNDGASAFSIATNLSSTGLFQYVQPNFYYMNLLNSVDDPNFNDQWGLKNTGQNEGIAGTDINIEQAWNITKGNSNIKIAVVDCGVELSHSDLSPCLITGYDVLLDIADGSKKQGNEYHGTCCSGIIGAQHNNICTAGIAPDCKIIPIRAIHGSEGSSESLSSGIFKAVELDADVISNSWTIGNSNEFDIDADISSAIDYAKLYGRGGKGCIIVFSSGNGNKSHVEYPSSTPGVIAVGAIDRCGQRAGEAYLTEDSCDPWPNILTSDRASSFGSSLCVVAPGASVATLHLTDSANGYNNHFKGTSASCPHVAGVAALMLSVNPHLSPYQVSAIIMATAKKTGNYHYDYYDNHPYGEWNDTVGYGLVNAGAAVKMASDLADVGDLYVKDNIDNNINNNDTGIEPNTSTSVFYDAPEIAVYQDGHEVNTIYARQNYDVHVTVRNCDSRDTPSGKKVKLYWSCVSNRMPWNSAWKSLPQFPWRSSYFIRGGYVGECSLPLIYAGAYTVASINWTVPSSSYTGSVSPNLYNNYSWSYSLLAIVEDGYVTAGKDFTDHNINRFVANNNNVARKNLTVIQENHAPELAAIEYPIEIDDLYPVRLQFRSRANTLGHHLTDYAQALVRFDDKLTLAWQNTGITPPGCIYKGNGLFAIIDTVVNFDGLQLDSSMVYFISNHIVYHTTPAVADQSFPFDINVYLTGLSDTLYGGSINYTAVYDENAYIVVRAHENQSALSGDNVTFTASCPASDAEYVWYNGAGNTVGTGDELNVTTTTSQKYYLVGHSEQEDAVGYDSVIVTIRRGIITSLTPNPATGQTIANYRLAADVTAANITVSSATGQLFYSSNLDTTQTTHTINLQSLPAGQYLVRIKSQGETLDTKTLIIY